MPWLRFFRDFPHFVRQIPGYEILQRRGTAHTPPPLLVVAASAMRLISVSRFNVRQNQSGLNNLTANQPKCRYAPSTIRSAVLRKHKYLVSSNKALSLTSNRYRKHIRQLDLRCLLLSSAMRSNAGMAKRQGHRLALRASLHLQLELWVGLDTEGVHIVGRRIKKNETTFDSTTTLPSVDRSLCNLTEARCYTTLGPHESHPLHRPVLHRAAPSITTGMTTGPASNQPSQ
jgi:hypothetical protein